MKVTNGQAGSLSLDNRDEMGNRPPASILETALAGAGLGLPGAGLMSSPSLAASSKSGQSPSMGITSVLAAKPITAPPRKAPTSKILEPTTLSQPRLTQSISATSCQLGGASVLEGAGVSSRTFPPAPTLATPPLNILESPKASGPPAASQSAPRANNRTVQKIIVKGTDGKVIPLSAATLQKLIEAGAIKPGTQIATPDFSPDIEGGGNIRIVQQPAREPAGSKQ